MRIQLRLPGLIEWAVITRATDTTRGTNKIRFWNPIASGFPGTSINLPPFLPEFPEPPF